MSDESERRIPVSGGKYFAVVDAADYEWLSLWKWCLNGHRYAARREGFGKPMIYMHRLIAATPDGMKTDHINGNGLDNRRCNLRNVTNQQNSFNKRISKKNTSGFRGVSFIKGRGWRAAIKINNRSITLGHFGTAEEAASTRLRAEAELYGEHAVAEGEAQ